MLSHSLRPTRWPRCSADLQVGRHSQEWLCHCSARRNVLT